MSDLPDPRFAGPRTLFFGIGAQKSATSWLHQHLREHPEVCLPLRKEQHYWSTRRLPQPSDRHAWVDSRLRRVAERGPIDRLLRTRRGRNMDEAWRRTEVMLRHDSAGHAAYADVLFQAYGGEPVVGEITPDYALLGSEDFAEIAGLASDVRFIFILRDPVDRLLSGVRQKLRKTRGADAVTTDNVAEHLGEAVRQPSHPAMLRSRYDLTIDRLESAVRRDKICYFFFETMFQQAEMDRLADFLGIATAPARVDAKVHVSAGRDIGVAADLGDLARSALQPTYDFVTRKFGALTPEAWQGAPIPEARRAAAGSSAS